MIATFIGNVVLPKSTISDEILGRVYYAVSTCMDVVQTVAKVARSVFASAMALVFLGQSSYLNRACRLTWDDVGFSLQMTAYSLFGILNPQRAWVMKCEAHMSNLPYFSRLEFSEFVLEGRGLGANFMLVGQMVESGIRYVASATRYLAAKLLFVLSFENAKFVELAGEGAYNSAEFANREIRQIFQAIR